MKMPMHRIGLGALLVCIFLTGYSGTAAAHVLQENNGVSAVLHIPPDDNPVAAQDTSLDFSFSSEHNTVSLSDCNCHVTVKNNGQKIQQVTLVQRTNNGRLDATATVQFPSIGVYDVIVTGSSKQAKFQSFRLGYLERVATTANTTSYTKSGNSLNVVLISAASFVLLLMFAYAAIRSGKRYIKTTPTSKNTHSKSS